MSKQKNHLSEPEELAGSRRTRRLVWPNCRNIRDLGGLPIHEGGRTCWRAVVRADSLCDLNAAGQEALTAYGIRTIIDVRAPSEVVQTPHPFAAEAARPDGLAYLSVPFLSDSNLAEVVTIEPPLSTEAMYNLMLDRCTAPVGAIFHAVAIAPPGGVLIHCTGGRDRTGLVSALLLSLIGVPDSIVAADYAGQHLEIPLHPNGAEDLQTLGPLQPIDFLRITPAVMLVTLSRVQERYGGARGYLRTAGVGEEDILRLRHRLQAGESI